MEKSRAELADLERNFLERVAETNSKLKQGGGGRGAGNGGGGGGGWVVFSVFFVPSSGFACLVLLCRVVACIAATCTGIISPPSSPPAHG